MRKIIAEVVSNAPGVTMFLWGWSKEELAWMLGGIIFYSGMSFYVIGKDIEQSRWDWSLEEKRRAVLMGMVMAGGFGIWMMGRMYRIW